LPEEKGGGGRSRLAWKLVTAFVIGALASGIAVALIVRPGSSKKAPPAASRAIDMAAAVGVSCGAPVAPGPAHPDPLLSQIFTVRAAKTTYTLGWQIVPFQGAGRTYRFATGGNLLALEPTIGGRPVGFGRGTVTFGAKTDAGTIDAVITLKSGGSLSVTGRWRCLNESSTTTTVVPSTPA
jgi:hypothetical protein